MVKWNATAALALALLAGPALAQDQPQQPEKPAPKTAQPGQKPQGEADPAALREKASYAFGLNIGRSIKAQNVEIETEVFIRGLKDALGGKDPAYPLEELQAAVQQYGQQMQAKAAAQLKQQAAAGLKEAQQFLAQNKAKEGVKSTESGLQYQILQKGSGKTPDENDVVKVHYTGTLTDGTVFDSSRERGEPVEFALNRVIPGWSEAVQLLQVGGKGKFWIPPDMAYGEDPPPGSPIGVNDVLVFEIELLNVTAQSNKPATENAPAAGQGSRPKPQPRDQ